ncbi:hypothetical protein GCM10022408_36180 [Hymenobacter fastidiosus]|uniref:FAD/NAD(P)-binding domain-containing protein n=1 Tax=Hymenobacter fastidiosus TaxID=486264 RepID=A0ABP7SZX6_9BACT
MDLQHVLCDGKGVLLTGCYLRADPRCATSRKHTREPLLLETCVPGISAAGTMARGASAVGEGSMAIKFVHQYLDE